MFTRLIIVISLTYYAQWVTFNIYNILKKPLFASATPTHEYCFHY